MDGLLDAPWWVLAFFTIGLLATVTGLITLFFALGRRPTRMWTYDVAEVGSDDFLRPVASLLNVPIRKGGHAELLDNGDTFIPAMLEAFERAEHSINFMVYIWEPGKLSDLIFDALVARAQAGIQVRVLLDGFGGIRCPGDDIDRLTEAGGRVEVFRPPRLGKLLRFHRRNHRRAIVIDGLVGFTGGAAVGDKWLGDARNPDEWRDAMFRVAGGMAEHLQSAFADLWAFSTGEILTGASFFPNSVDDESDPDPDAVHSIGINSAPSSEEHPLRLLFFLTFLAARERLWIVSPYFVPDKHTREVVKRRARAGVDVRVLLPNEHTDARPIRRASHSYYSELLNAGVRIFEYQPTMMHTKAVVVDSRWSVIGSANMDIRSKELNEENVLGILEPAFARQLEESFEADFRQSREIDRVAWRRRGIGARILERISVLFAEQY
jgi:cardiolipin synthase A/B